MFSFIRNLLGLSHSVEEPAEGELMEYRATLLTNPVHEFAEHTLTRVHRAEIGVQVSADPDDSGRVPRDGMAIWSDD